MVYGLFCPHRFSISSILYSQRLNTSLDGKGTWERGKKNEVQIITFATSLLPYLKGRW